MRQVATLTLAPLLLLSSLALAEEKSATPPPPAYDEALAKSTGADERGMRKFVLVILKTGPTRVPDGPERDEMFRFLFANIERLAN